VAGGLLVASAGWRWIFFINVPVGVVAVAAGWFLLPRTRHRANRQGTDLLGLILLAATATGTLIAISAISGLGLPLPGLAGCAAVALLAGAALVWWERRAAAPLVDVGMLAATGTGPLLAGALCAYLVLFGPLVLIPQVLTAHGGSVVHAGLLLSALPAGFGLAAVAGEKILPAAWPDRRRCLAGGLLAAGSTAALAIPAPDMVIAAWLGLLGVGLGTYIPANNTAIMTAIPPRQVAAAGGMVNMARGLGTALGVAVVTLALHAAARLGHPSAGQAAAMAALTLCALASAWAGRRIGAGPHSQTVSADGRDSQAVPR
jgi:MFS family permease